MSNPKLISHPQHTTIVALLSLLSQASSAHAASPQPWASSRHATPGSYLISGVGGRGIRWRCPRLPAVFLSSELLPFLNPDDNASYLSSLSSSSLTNDNDRCLSCFVLFIFGSNAFLVFPCWYCCCSYLLYPLSYTWRIKLTAYFLSSYCSMSGLVAQ